MQIIIDMDGTICQEMRTYSRCLAEPKLDAIESINRLYDAGNIIIIYSSRTWLEWEMTTAWLKSHGVKYHQLMMGKPVGDVWIDDRSMKVDDNWKEIADKLLQQ
jgi:uncharacterized HAD superfamily protein